MSNMLWTIGSRFRALGLLVALLLSWGALPASLILGDASGCSMSCCEEEGECCCFIALRELDGQQGDRPATALSTQLRTPCSQNCATPVPSYQFASPGLPRRADWQNSAPEGRLMPLVTRPRTVRSIDLSPSVPRGPLSPIES